MQTRDIIVIGGSAGALGALRRVVRALPHGFKGSLFVVIHTAPHGSGALPAILARAGALPAEAATDGVHVRQGRIYVARPDHHLLLEPGRIRVTRGPRENRFRPAVDPLFRTAAAAYGPRVIGVILSGGQDDGVFGLALIKRHGGIAIAQDPADAETPSMPQNAIRQVHVDHVLRAEDIGTMISGLVPGATGERTVAAEKSLRDTAVSGERALSEGARPGPPTPFTCPDCGGALWELRDGDLIRFQCHVGHGFSVDSLVTAQADGLERALWAALRALEESAALRRRMAERAREAGMSAIADSYAAHAQDSESRAGDIRRVLVSTSPDPESRTPPARSDERARTAGGSSADR